ncbi:MAG: acetyl ornithine aminotransferase family protein [Chloroflexi bacterium]|nr:acetyl ornithine aminotransferase family protein [Chloroflexota bacterium]
MELHLDQAGPQARTVIERDIAALSPSYTREYPLVVDHAQGSEVWDIDGRRYVDFMSGIGVLNVGHRHPKVVEAVRAQVDKFWHICLSDFYYENAVELAEKLQATAPMTNGSRVFFSNSGTEAVEAAVKLAMYHTRRTRFIGFLGGFHGRTLGALSFTASKMVQRASYQLGLKVYHLPYPNPYRPLLVHPADESYGDTVVDYLEEQLFRTTLSPKDVAAIMVEPIQGEGGYIVPAPNFMKRLRHLCDEHGILLIVDEIQSGIGRTGKWWAVEHDLVEPDIVCFAKGVASGLPLGGIIAREKVMNWESGTHGSTFGGNPVAVAAAVATLNVIEEEGLMTRATETGQYMMDALAEMQTRHPSIGEVRGRGLMVAAEFVKDQTTKERAVALRNEVIQNAFNRGLLLLPCGTNTIRFIPSLNIPMPLVEEGLRTFEEVLTAVEADYLA